jgi:phage terminase large subunit
LEIVRDNLKDRIIELSNGSTIRMGSISQVDSCVGRSYSLILFDEAALSKNGKEAFNISLRPTLDRPNSKAIFISTPRGKLNWFSEFYARGSNPEYPEWASMTADYTENPRMTDKDVEEARKSMSKAEFEQEYFASFNTFEGQIYTLTEEHIIDELPEGKYEVIAGLDVGYRDPTAFVVIYYETETGIYYIVEDYLEAKNLTSEHAKKFQELIAKHKIEIVFIDSAAAQFGADLAYTYDIATTLADKSILPGINYVQNLVENGRVKVLRSCTHVLDSFDQYQWDTDTEAKREKPEHNLASNIADAVRYAIYTFTV